jgi:hypothetical protein
LEQLAGNVVERLDPQDVVGRRHFLDCLCLAWRHDKHRLRLLAGEHGGDVVSDDRARL